ncbi:YgfZ/GcvT domain-containing protein [Azorhizobium doebereinerae]|uniref:CAF17-like 4Fe-4S cluster assembly/insertion protein YgfZ n=1 Tax=Azorhizobium doebereinerae TaxID=281091 RepID=UPI0004299AC5|nr:folate-binding protein YgfZ [Azorhizobium doebereinerae]
MPLAYLADRAVVTVTGPDARAFLHNVITCNVKTLTPGQARYGALLMPQGKIISDFLVYAPTPATDTAKDEPEHFLLDAPRALAGDLLKRFTMYLLRSKVAFALAEDRAVVAAWGDAAPPEGAEAFADPRLAELGTRSVVPLAQAQGIGGDAQAYAAHRIALGIPQGGADFIYGDAFPHEADMDQLGGVDFKKGCYIGQEVVSRTQHRGIARTRAVEALFAFAPEAGAEIRAGEKTVGRIGSSAAGQGIALVRLDRVAEAKASGLPLVAGGVEVTLKRPAWATFDMEGV